MNKIALITGGNKGIGFGIVQALLQEAPEFSTVILTARNPELGQRALDSLGNPANVVFFKMDVESLEDIASCAKFVQENFGKIDVLINNAGYLFNGDDFNYNIVSTTIGINFYGVKHVTEAFLPLLNENGHIVNISSDCGETRLLDNENLASRFLDPNLTTEGVVELAEEFKEFVRLGTWKDHGWPTFGYAVSKNLLNSYTRTLNKEFLKGGVKLRVNAVHPGWVKTDMTAPDGELTIEEGVRLPVRVIRDTSDLSGKFWRDGNHYEPF